MCHCASWLQEEDLDKVHKMRERSQQTAAFLGFMRGKQDAELKISL